MFNEKIKWILLIVFTALYNYLFWQEKPGLNILLFSLASIAALFYLFPGSRHSNSTWLFAGSVIISGMLVVWNNSIISKVIHITGFISLISYFHYSTFRTFYNSFFTSFNSFFLVPSVLIDELKTVSGKNLRIRGVFSIMRISVIPLLVFLLFYIIYANANPLFDDYSNTFWSWISENIFFVFNISLTHFLFIAAGIIIIGSMFFTINFDYFKNKEAGRSDLLFRKRRSGIRKTKPYSSVNPLLKWPVPFKMKALYFEHRIALFLLFMVNMLLFIVNLIDINWIWFGFTVPEGFSLKQFVHEGTYLLILSMILSIGILLYFFRNNQNFYKGNNRLKFLAYSWIAQNIILCISVFLRNYHYISFHGLAYKRIGVIIFLLLTLICLVTLYFKISKLKSSFYLLRINTWSLYIVMLFTSMISWDTFIARYNVNHWNSGEIDTDFYFTLSDKALPVLYENLDKIENQMQRHKENDVRWVENLEFRIFREELDRRRFRFFSEQKNYSWLSWNYADHHTRANLMD
jgi:hypothetical protein